ncbi:MAG: hypothetical protein KBA11_05895 [Sedimentibacter sp.]|nr:hypothetical protein [Sedimentibacter sp.]
MLRNEDKIFKGERRKKLYVTCVWQYKMLKKYCDQVGVRLEYVSREKYKTWYELIGTIGRVRVVVRNYYEEIRNWGSDYGKNIKEKYYEDFKKKPGEKRRKGLVFNVIDGKYSEEPGERIDKNRFDLEILPDDLNNPELFGIKSIDEKISKKRRIRRR